MRVADRPVPAYVPHAADNVDWPMSLHVIVEDATTFIRWDSPSIVWDDARVKWDTDQYAGTFRDIGCDLMGADISHGPPDDLGLFPAGQVQLTLDNPDGRYTRYKPDGTLVTTQLGRRLGVILNAEHFPGFAVNEQCWLFYGRITSWVDVGNDMVEVTAYNVVNDMTPIGTYTSGVNNDTVAQRLAALMATAGVADAVRRVDAGTVRLTAQATTQSPWEESQTVALSDGGTLFADADDALVYLDRNSKARTDQRRYPLLSDNDCDDADLIIWDAELSTNDESLATGVVLANVAGLTVTRQLLPNTFNTTAVLKHPNKDQWSTQAEGDALGTFLLNKYSVPMVEVPSFAIHVDDPRFPNMWALAADLRIGDRITFRHDYAPNGTLVVGGIVNFVGHSITPEQWVMHVGAWSFVLSMGTTGLAGLPGRWVDASGVIAAAPPNFNVLTGPPLAASPDNWIDGQYATLGDGTEVYHTASGWQLGRAPFAYPSYWQVGRWQVNTWATAVASTWDTADVLWDDLPDEVWQ